MKPFPLSGSGDMMSHRFGGPYATSEYRSILKDKNIDIVVLGKRRISFLELIEQIIRE